MIEALLAALKLGYSAAFFNVDVYLDAGDTARLRRLTLLMLFLAGLSRATGTVAILALNRVPGRRYPFVFAVEGLVFVLTALAFAVSAVLADHVFLGNALANSRLFWIVALAHAPMLFGVLILMPYLGEAIDRGLRLWTAALVYHGLFWGFEMPVWAALGTTLIGWVTYAVLSATLGHPAGHLASLARRIAAGAR